MNPRHTVAEMPFFATLKTRHGIVRALGRRRAFETLSVIGITLRTSCKIQYVHHNEQEHMHNYDIPLAQ